MEIKGMTFSNNLKFLGWTIALFLLPIIFFVSLLVVGYQKSGQLQWLDAISLSAFLFIVISIVIVPGFLLHIKYYKNDKGKSLRFRPTYFEIMQNKKSDKIYYKNIARIEVHYSTWSFKNPWSEYGYIKIILKDNSVFSYSCLTHDFISSQSIFRRNGVMVVDCGEFYPW
jgi:hypothetical protein